MAQREFVSIRNADEPLPRSRIPVISGADRYGVALSGILALAAALRLLWLGDIPLFHDEAYYWVWSEHILPFQNLELSFYDHPPAVAYILAASRFLFGDSELGVRALFALLGVANVWLIYRLGKYLYDEKTGLIAALLLAINFGHIFVSRIATNDVAACFFFTAVIFAFAKASLEDNKRGWLIITGLLLGISFLVKYTLVVVVAGFAVFVHFNKVSRKRVLNRDLLIAGVLFALCTIPVLVWNAQHDWASFRYQGTHASPFLGLVVGPGSFWQNFINSLVYYPEMWMMFSSIPLTLLLVFGILGTFRARARKGPVVAGIIAFGAVAFFYFNPAMPVTALVALELVVLLCIWLSFNGFQNEKDALLVLSSLSLMLFFAFSLGRMPHWTIPALGPLSILGARIAVRGYRHFSLSRKAFTAYAVGCMAVFAWGGFYGASSAYSAGTGDCGPDPRSVVSTQMAITFSTTKLMTDDLNSHLADYPHASILVPQWVTYSPVAYYCQGPDIWTYQRDFQIGEVWKRDIRNMARTPTEVIVPVYLSTFLGKMDEAQVLAFLVYSSTNDSNPFWGSNGDTVFSRTGIDTFEVLSVGEAVYENTYYWQKGGTLMLSSYFIAAGHLENDGNVSVIFNGTKYWCPKPDLQYDGPRGPSWDEKFYVEEQE